MANVASASDTPASLSAGIPKRKPMTPVISPAITIVNTGRMPSPSGSQSGRLEQERFEAGPAEREHGADVSTDPHERAVPERDLTVVAREDVQAEQRDEVDRDERELREAELAHEPRQHGDHERAAAKNSATFNAGRA